MASDPSQLDLAKAEWNEAVAEERALMAAWSSLMQAWEDRLQAAEDRRHRAYQIVAKEYALKSRKAREVRDGRAP